MCWKFIERFIQEKYNLDFIIPLSVDNDAKHRNLVNYLKRRKLIDKIKDKGYKLKEKMDDKISKEDNSQDSLRNRNLVDARIKN